MKPFVRHAIEFTAAQAAIAADLRLARGSMAASSAETAAVDWHRPASCLLQPPLVRVQAQQEPQRSVADHADAAVVAASGGQLAAW